MKNNGINNYRISAADLRTYHERIWDNFAGVVNKHPSLVICLNQPMFNDFVRNTGQPEQHFRYIRDSIGVVGCRWETIDRLYLLPGWQHKVSEEELNIRFPDWENKAHFVIV